MPRTFVAFLMLCVLGTANAMAPQRVTVIPDRAAGVIVSPHARLMRFLMQPIDDPDRLRGYRVAILAADGVDGFDLEVPRRFLSEQGATVHVIVPRPAESPQGNRSDAAGQGTTQLLVLEPSGEQRSALSDRFIDQVRGADYDAVYLPSNRASAKALTKPPEVAFVKQAADEGKAIFAIGNSALLLLQAGLLDHKPTALSGGGSGNGPSPSSTSTADVALVNGAVIFIGRDAFDVPVLMDNLIATLLGRPVARR